MKYEDKYGECADHLFVYPIKDASDKLYLLEIFEDCLGAEINKDIAEKEMKDLFDSWHERGIMKPKRNE